MWLGYSKTSFFKILLIFIFWQASTHSKPFPLVWNAPPENPHFVGREDILNDILNLFNSAPLKTAVIGGAQGFGKSQTAKRFVYQNFANYDVVWWFRANQYMKPQFEKFALAMSSVLGLNIENSIGAIGHERLISMVKEGIRLKNLKCLIVFDDTQTYSEIEPYILFSHDKTIHTLITTKNGNFSSNSLQIKPFPRSDSLKYINLFLPNDPDSSKYKLADHLGDCPAALAIAIDYIKSYPSMTIERYLSKHTRQKLNLPFQRRSTNKFGSSIDGYEKDILAAIQINMKELRERSEEAYQLLSLFSLLHRDEIAMDLIEKWVIAKGIKTNIMTLVSIIKQYSLIEVTDSKTNKEVYLTMQDLIQEIVSSSILDREKRMRIDEAILILQESFAGMAGDIAKELLKNNAPLLHTIKLSEEADSLNYHSPSLSSVRISLLNVLVGYMRDFDTGKKIVEHIKNDLENKITISNADNILYHTNLFILSAVRSEFEKVKRIGEATLKLLNTEETMHEEKVRLYSNLIQFCSLTGTIEEASKFVEAGEKLLVLSKAPEHNCLYVYATSKYHIDRGEIDKAIALTEKYRGLLDQQAAYHPSMRFFTLYQLAEACLKKGEIEESKSILSLAEQQGKEFYGDNDQNNFFGRVYVLKGMCLFKEAKYFDKAKSFIDLGVRVFENIYKGSDKHRDQAFAHLQLGKLYHGVQEYHLAKASYLKSEEIFNKILKNQKIDDVSHLYKQLAILGADTKDEPLVHTYLKKQVDIFGLDHFRTKEVLIYLDERGIIAPM
ncbi:MAG: hypothetical protein K2Y18_08255 [Alphaproteobacteria bacterium]|jgi:tetratricopeptide (TPR) repeat protein|nr:hypothetical protein [Alphaproteobacteria bacterium]